MAKLTCLVCLQKYLKDDDLYSLYQPRLLSSPPTSSTPENLYTRFLHLCTRHLKLNLATLPLLNGRRDNSAFCPKCKCLVSYLCDLYHELEIVKLHLHWKLEELGKQIKIGLTRKQCNKSQKALSEQLNVSTLGEVKYFRRMMREICTRKNVPPKLVIARGLIPEMWKFPYSETRSTLARLIFLFALASEKLCSKPEVKQPVFKKEEDDYHPQDADECGEDFAGYQSDNGDFDLSNALSPAQDLNISKELGTRNIRRILRKRKLLGSETGPASKSKRIKRNSRRNNNKESQKKSRWTRQCSKCDKKFTEGTSLKKHLVQVHGSQTTDFGCPICWASGGFERRIMKHMPTHNITSDKDRPCEACGEWFENELILSKHFEQAHLGKFCCLQPQCEAKYETLAELSTHLESHEGPEKSFQCYFCSRNFTTEQFLKVHTTAHGNTLIICDKLECSEKFENVSDLNDHLKSHLEPDKKILHCSKCNWGFLSNTDLLLHQLQHTPHSSLNNGGYKCPKCKLQFNYINTLRNHFYNFHLNNDSTPLNCSDCDYTTHSPTYFKLHSLSHSVAQETPSLYDLTCGSCGKDFVDKIAIRIHKLINHPRNRNVPERHSIRSRHTPNLTCKICNEVLETLLKLENHMVSIHNNPSQANHQCWFCPKRFSLPETLEVHRWSEHIHTDLFRCDETNCKQVFSTFEEHEEHLQSHLDDTPTGSILTLAIHHCPKCNLGFLNSALRDYHELNHLERNGIDKEYVCPKCNGFYSNKQSIRSHYRQKHLDSESLSKISAMRKPEKRRKTDKKLFTCNAINCTYTTIRKCDLKKHIKRIRFMHPGTTHTCHICGLVLPRMRAKLTHLKAEHKIQTKEHLCPTCGATFVLSRNLKAHMRNVHCESRHICEICGQAFKKNQYLIDHKDRHHNPNRTAEHICSTCGKAYFTESGLSLHIYSVHVPEEEKKFGCPYCPRRYHREVVAKRHVKTCMQQKGLEVPDDLDEIEVDWNAEAITQLVKYGRRGSRKLKGSKSDIKKD